MLVPSRSLQGDGNLAAICIINTPAPGEHLGNEEGIQSILDLNFNIYTLLLAHET